MADVNKLERKYLFSYCTYMFHWWFYWFHFDTLGRPILSWNDFSLQVVAFDNAHEGESSHNNKVRSVGPS